MLPVDPVTIPDPAPASRLGDASFEQTALPWLDAVYRFARSLARNEADADDLVQETFLRALRAWHTFHTDGDCRRWLFAICHNAHLGGIRQAGRRPAAIDGDIDSLPAVLLHHLAVKDGTDELVARLDLRPALSRALATLSEPFRAVVLLVDGEGHTYTSAAETLGVPVGTVRSRLFRARRLLQESLFACARDAGLTTEPPLSDSR